MGDCANLLQNKQKFHLFYFFRYVASSAKTESYQKTMPAVLCRFIRSNRQIKQSIVSKATGDICDKFHHYHTIVRSQLRNQFKKINQTLFTVFPKKCPDAYDFHKL